jgi:hypothetical protein
MMISDERLRLKDENTFVEAEPPEGRSRPLEWRRSLNALNFDAFDFVIDSVHNENRSVYLVGPPNKMGGEFICPIEDGERSYRITVFTKVSFDTIRDQFYKILPIAEEEGVFIASRDDRAQFVTLNLKEGSPSAEDWDFFKSGSYHGSAGFWDGDGNLNIDILASKESLVDLIEVISSKEFEKVTFNILVSSFSYEVDDGLRDWYHPRDLLINKVVSAAALESFTIRRKKNSPNLRVEGREIHIEDKSGKDSVLKDMNIDSDLKSNEVFVDGASLKSIKVALWVIVLALFLLLFK